LAVAAMYYYDQQPRRWVPYWLHGFVFVVSNLSIISMPTGTSEIAPMTESSIMQETRKLSTLKVSKGISV